MYSTITARPQQAAIPDPTEAPTTRTQQPPIKQANKRTPDENNNEGAVKRRKPQIAKTTPEPPVSVESQDTENTQKTKTNTALATLKEIQRISTKGGLVTDFELELDGAPPPSQIIKTGTVRTAPNGPKERYKPPEALYRDKPKPPN